MENNNTPHIEQKLDGSIEFYENSVFEPEILFVILAAISLFVLEEYFKIKNLAFIVIIFFAIIDTSYKKRKQKRQHTQQEHKHPFFLVKSIRKSRPFISIKSAGIQIKGKHYLWQNISKIYAYTTECHYPNHYHDIHIIPNNSSNRSDLELIELYNYNLEFVFSGNEEPLKLFNLKIYEREWQILLDNLKKHKEIIEDVQPPAKEVNVASLVKDILKYTLLIVLFFVVIVLINFPKTNKNLNFSENQAGIKYIK